MFNQFASLSARFLSSRTVRFGSYFLLALGCGVVGPSMLGGISSSNAVESLNLNGGLFEFVRSGSPATSVQWSPTMVACVVFLVGIVGFLLQPLYLRPRSKSRRSQSKYNLLKRIFSTQLASVSASHPSIVPPLIDRLIITPQSIVASTCRSVEAVPEIEFVPRTVESFNQLLVQSTADIVILTRSEMTLGASEIVLGIQQLQNSSFDVITPQRSLAKGQFNQDSNNDSPNSSPALHNFICDVFGLHQTDLKSTVQTRNKAHDETSSDYYIVRREALLSILNLSQWSSTDFLTNIKITPPSQPIKSHLRVLTRV